MQLSYARATVSDHDATVNRTWEPCLYLKNNMAHDLSISKKYSVSDPTIGAMLMLMQTHAIMNRDLSLIILGVASSLGQIGCVVLPYTRLTRASVSRQGARTPPGPSCQANL